MRKKVIKKASITGWIDKSGARELLEDYVKKHVYKRQDIALGSCRFKNGKDKSDGYETRIIVTSGIHPELEQVIIRPRKSRRLSTIKKSTTVRKKRVSKSKSVKNKITKLESINKEIPATPVTDSPVKRRRRKKSGLSIMNTVTIDGNSYLIEDGVYSRHLDKVYLYLTSDDIRAIGEYDLKKSVTLYKYLDKDEEQGFCDWTRFCNQISYPREMA